MPIIFLFFCSGATALVYEVVWSKYLALIFGSTIYAQTVVLAVFMGGLALGNWLFGRRADLLKQPLAAYGYVEMAIGIYAFFFDFLHGAADKVFVAVGTGMLEKELLLLIWKGIVAIGLLIIPTILMGGTLPLVASWLQRNLTDASRVSARFYSINSLGAVTGSLLAGFFLVRSLGLVATLQAAALVNLVIGGIAIAVARSNGEQEITKSEAAVETKSPVSGGEVGDAAAQIKLAVLLVALTGGVSMGLEVLAARSLVLIFGASLQSFALVLVSFILGIGFGAAVIASPGRQWAKREQTTVVLLLGAGLYIGLFIWNAENAVNVYRELRTAVASTSRGYQLQLVINVLISLVVLGIPAALLGAVLPLWMRAAKGGASGLAEYVGRLLTWNTVGAVVGVMLTGFVLMPVLGVRAAFGVLALTLCGGALALASKARLSKAFLIACGSAGFILFTMVTGGESWKHVMSSGVFRLRETTVDYGFLPGRVKDIKLIYYKDAPDATVSVESVPHPDEPHISLRINGKTDASSHGDLSTQLLLGHLGLLARPQAENMFILGLGSGVTASAALAHPVKEIVVAENCKPVVESAALFGKWNREVLKAPNVKVVFEDARTVLKLGGKNYDVIVCEPSNPWVAGVGSVFSREFYELAASHLKPNGVVVQWFHIYEMHDGVVDLVVKTFSSVFPNMEIWDPGEGDFIMIGSQQPWSMSMDTVRKVVESRPLVKEDFAKIGLQKPEHLFVRQMASGRTAFAIADGSAVQSDAFPLLEYEAPRAFFLRQAATDFLVYDERTWQSSLANAQKKQFLASLTADDFREIFKEYKSVNPLVATYVKQRIASGTNTTTVPIFSGNNPTPLIFQSYEGSSQLPNYPENPTPVLRALLDAEALIFAKPTEWRVGVEAIEKTLTELGKNPPPEGVKWQPEHFMALAVKTAMANGDFAVAERLLNLGQYVHEEREMRYLRRILAVANPPKTTASQLVNPVGSK